MFGRTFPCYVLRVYVFIEARLNSWSNHDSVKIVPCLSISLRIFPCRFAVTVAVAIAVTVAVAVAIAMAVAVAVSATFAVAIAIAIATAVAVAVTHNKNACRQILEEMVIEQHQFILE